MWCRVFAAKNANRYSLQGTNISPFKGTFEDDVPNVPRWDMWSFPGGYKLPLHQHQLVFLSLAVLCCSLPALLWAGWLSKTDGCSCQSILWMHKLFLAVSVKHVYTNYITSRMSNISSRYPGSDSSESIQGSTTHSHHHWWTCRMPAICSHSFHARQQPAMHQLSRWNEPGRQDATLLDYLTCTGVMWCDHQHISIKWV